MYSISISISDSSSMPEPSMRPSCIKAQVYSSDPVTINQTSDLNCKTSDSHGQLPK